MAPSPRGVLTPQLAVLCLGPAESVGAIHLLQVQVPAPQLLVQHRRGEEKWAEVWVVLAKDDSSRDSHQRVLLQPVLTVDCILQLTQVVMPNVSKHLAFLWCALSERNEEQGWHTQLLPFFTPAWSQGQAFGAAESNASLPFLLTGSPVGLGDRVSGPMVLLFWVSEGTSKGDIPGIVSFPGKRAMCRNPPCPGPFPASGAVVSPRPRGGSLPEEREESGSLLSAEVLLRCWLLLPLDL